MALFDGDVDSDYFKRMAGLLADYQKEIEAMSRMAMRLNRLGLLASRSIALTRHGQNQHLSGFRAVDDGKFVGIDDAAGRGALSQWRIALDRTAPRTAARCAAPRRLHGCGTGPAENGAAHS